MTTNKAHRIRLKFYEAVGNFAELEGFALTYTKTKQRFNTPLWDMNLELTEIEDRKS